MSLDVGCSFYKECDVSVDMARDVEPDVICDAHFLPFKSEAIEYVVCSHLLEHLDSPIDCILEIKRVTKQDSKIIFRFPTEENRSIMLYSFRLLLLNLFFPSLPLVIKENVSNLRLAMKKSPAVFHKWVISPYLFNTFFNFVAVHKYGTYWYYLLSPKLKRFFYPLGNVKLFNAYEVECIKK